MAKKEKAKGRYDDYAFAKGWPSVSAIKGLRDKPWLNGWYASKGLEAFSIVKESQIVGNLVDNYIERFFGDPDVKDMSDVLKKYILTTDNRTMRGEYYQSIKNFHSFVKKFKPVSLAAQKVVWHQGLEYIGTFDRLFKVKDKIILGDWKATNHLDFSYLLQIEAYYRALIEMLKTNNIKIEGLNDPNDIKELWIVQFPKREDFSVKNNIIKLPLGAEEKIAIKGQSVLNGKEFSDLRFGAFCSLLQYWNIERRLLPKRKKA